MVMFKVISIVVTLGNVWEGMFVVWKEHLPLVFCVTNCVYVAIVICNFCCKRIGECGLSWELTNYGK